MLAFILSLKIMPNVSAYRPGSLFQEQLGTQRSYPVSHISLKTDQTDYREQCWKTIQSHAGLTLLNVIDSSTKGFFESLSDVLVAQERSLSFTYGRPDKSCRSFALMYFGNHRASQINLFWSR